MFERIASRTRGAAGTLLLVAAVAVAAELVSAGSPALTRSVVVALSLLVIVVALYLFVGNSGVMSFGHVSFVAIGAYTSGILTVPLPLRHVLLPHLPGVLLSAQWPTPAAVLAGGACAALIAAMLGLPLVRLAGIAAGIGTLALLVIVHVVALHWDAVTRGSGTFLGVPMDTSVESALAWVAAAAVFTRLYEASRWGRRLRASLGDPVAAAAVGIDVARERYIAFVASAFFAGVGGALYAHFLGSFSPDTFYLSMTFLVVAMVVVGGVTSLTGVVLGSLLLSVLSELMIRLEDGVRFAGTSLTAPTGSREIVLALAMLAALIASPGATAGALRRFRRRMAGGPSGTTESSTLPRVPTSSLRRGTTVPKDGR